MKKKAEEEESKADPNEDDGGMELPAKEAEAFVPHPEEEPEEKKTGLLVPKRERKSLMIPRNDLAIPHLVQIHADPILSGKVYYNLSN